jgi:hypothetical protein
VDLYKSRPRPSGKQIKNPTEKASNIIEGTPSALLNANETIQEAS